MKGKLITGDLQENTMTFEMNEPVQLKAGEYRILRDDSDIYSEYKYLIDTINERLSKGTLVDPGGNLSAAIWRSQEIIKD